MSVWADITFRAGHGSIEWGTTGMKFPARPWRVEIDPPRIGATYGGWRYPPGDRRRAELTGTLAAGSVTLFEHKLRMWKGQSSRALLCILHDFERGHGLATFGSVRVGNEKVRCGHEYYYIPKYEAKMTGSWVRASRPWKKENTQVWVGAVAAVSGAYGVRGEHAKAVVISCAKPHRICVFDCWGAGVGLVKGWQGGGGIALVTGAPKPWKQIHRRVQYGWDFSLNVGADAKALPALQKLPKVAKWTLDKLIEVLSYGSMDFVGSGKGIVAALGIDWYDTGVYFIGLAGGGSEIGVYYKFDQFYVKKVMNLQPGLDWLQRHSAALAASAKPR